MRNNDSDCSGHGSLYNSNVVSITVLDPVADAGPNKSITCGLGGTLIGSPPPNGLFTYSWSPTTGLSNPSVAQPFATPTYYYVLKLGGDISTPNAGNVYKGFVYLKR